MGFLDKPKEEEKEVVEKETKPFEKKEKKKEVLHKIVVVKELPVQVVRESVDEDGTILHYITAEEALTEFMNQ